MSYSFGARSKQRLVGVHPDIIKMLDLAISRSQIDFTVLEGLRTPARQRELFAAGATKTMNSRHLTGHAVDIAPVINGAVTFAWPPYYVLAGEVKAAALETGVPITWGGDWKTFKDGPHWELPWAQYPLPKG